MRKLSVVIAVYNEEKTIEKILEKVKAVDLGKDFEKEIIVVDDGSTDNTRTILKKFKPDCRIFYHDKNLGKGAALRTGFSQVSGDYILIQDADLEYDPKDYPKLLKPLTENKADVVYGSRFAASENHQRPDFWHRLGNKILTAFSNLMTGLKLSDMETCYKAFTRQALQKIAPALTSNRFGIEPEITAKIAKNRLRLIEVTLSYYSARTSKEGKKINWKDGLAAFWHIFKFNVF